MPTSLAKKKKMAFQTSIAFKDLERAKNDQSSMRVSVHQLSVEASVFNDAGGTNGDERRRRNGEKIRCRSRTCIKKKAN